METLGQPSWFGRYRLTSRIATGGMAEVYVGRHITPDGNFGPMVAVKRLLPHLIKDQAIVRMFLNEARITAQIEHANVVRAQMLTLKYSQAPGNQAEREELLAHLRDLQRRAAGLGWSPPTSVMTNRLLEIVGEADDPSDWLAALLMLRDEEGRADR